MSTRTRVGAVIGTATVLGLLFLIAGSGNAGDEKAVAGGIDKIAGLIEKGDAAGAKKQAEAMAKTTELEDVMHSFKLRKKKGRGVGKTPGAISPDGIEQKLIALGRDAPSAATLAKESDALVEMAYVTAAIAEFTIYKPTDKVKSAAQKDKWQKFTTEMREAAGGFAAAAKSKSSSVVKDAAVKLNTACNNCHSEFRE